MMGRKAARNMLSRNTNKNGIQCICWYYSQRFLVHISFVWYRRYIILPNDSVVKQTTCLLLFAASGFGSNCTSKRFRNEDYSFQICDAVSLGHIQGDLNLRQRCCDTCKSLDLLILKVKYKTADEFPSLIITHSVSSMNCESVHKPIRYLKGIGKTS